MDHESNSALLQGSTTSLGLLFSLLFSLLILPVLEGLHTGRALLLVGLTITFVVGAMAARARLRLVTLVLLAVALPTTWATLFVNSKLLFVLHCLLGSAFFWLIGGIVVYAVIRTHVVSFDSVFSAISAYLLFGLAWALSYWAIHSVMPDAFSLPESRAATGGAEIPQVKDFSHFIYYSFVTMSTLGYGDMTPLNRITQTLSWLQSVTGQFYVAVVIAWLVSALPRPGNSK
ncbi:MAG: ion channel [Aeoliella sp.]